MPQPSFGTPGDSVFGTPDDGARPLSRENTELLMFGWHTEAMSRRLCIHSAQDIHEWRHCRKFCPAVIESQGRCMYVVCMPDDRTPPSVAAPPMAVLSWEHRENLSRSPLIGLIEGFSGYTHALPYATALALTDAISC